MAESRLASLVIRLRHWVRLDRLKLPFDWVHGIYLQPLAEGITAAEILLTSRRIVSYRRNCGGHRGPLHFYFIAFMLGSIQETTKSAISGNCATTKPKAGIPTKLTILNQKAEPSVPGTVLVI